MQVLLTCTQCAGGVANTIGNRSSRALPGVNKCIHCTPPFHAPSLQGHILLVEEVVFVFEVGLRLVEVARPLLEFKCGQCLVFSV